MWRHGRWAFFVQNPMLNWDFGQPSSSMCCAEREGSLNVETWQVGPSAFDGMFLNPNFSNPCAWPSRASQAVCALYLACDSDNCAHAGNDNANGAALPPTHRSAWAWGRRCLRCGSSAGWPRKQSKLSRTRAMGAASNELSRMVVCFLAPRLALCTFVCQVGRRGRRVRGLSRVGDSGGPRADCTVVLRGRGGGRKSEWG